MMMIQYFHNSIVEDCLRLPPLDSLPLGRHAPLSTLVQHLVLVSFECKLDSICPVVDEDRGCEVPPRLHSIFEIFLGNLRKN
jgi:hypothetical protein